ncbi:ABC transporter ATP-binding protein [Massilia sp. ST3]|uniref:ABC transporter ATP-binding protein n=1 Tax=Massilia sp. ST3 TaxID=2824903 RepID=UPI001B83FD54|nr:ABC transporter ATP-binding protein [Massilia sp. ST3]MBQ5946235.1 ABC transporter ATP-binding protein [Massilia sp. ST3]
MAVKIVIDDIRKSFAKGGASLPVVGGIQLQIEDGEFLAIVGPSGCGKSTLMKMISGFEQPDSGAVTIDGERLTRPGPKGIVISQHGSVFPWLTVQENLMFGLNEGERAHKARLADHYAEMVGLKGFENAYPRELSGGMLKRVEIARALVVKPEILYMDEPFSALDALMNLRMRNELLRILQEERHTVVLITHDVEEALYLADRIVVLSPRPATVQASFAVTQPHPRKVSSPELQEMKDAILGQLGLSV